MISETVTKNSDAAPTKESCLQLHVQWKFDFFIKGLS
jgi:hypothetical protein